MVDLTLLLENPTFTATAGGYAGATALYAAAWRSARPRVARVATGLFVWAALGNLTLIVSRWLEAGRPPFKSLFESMVFLAFCIAVVYLVAEWLYRTRVFGALAAGGAALALVYALTKWDAEIVKLPPALQSGWFVPHVVVYFVGYAALFLAAAASVVQLLRPELAVRAGTIFDGSQVSMERVALDSIRFGFAMLTVGLFFGSVWAKAAWGDYWVWDPKENWSLVSWLVYGAYLHLRRVKGWQGKRAAWLAIAGFAVVMFTYLGMELLPTSSDSAHVYQD